MLSDRIRELRKTHGYSQQQIALKMHITQGAVSQWETGNTEPAADQLIALADIFGIKVDDLLGRDTPSKHQNTIRDNTASLIADMTPAELEQLQTYAEFLKSQRK